MRMAPVARLAVLTGAVGLLLLAAACRSDHDRAEVAPSSATADRQAAYQRPDERPLVHGPVSAEGLQAILATADLGVGRNRVGFALTSPDALVTVPEVGVAAYFVASDGSQARQEAATAAFHPWPYGTRGLYTTSLTFDRPGSWHLEISVPLHEGSAGRVELPLEVKSTPSAPATGSAAIKSVNKTAADVDSLSKLTTGSLHDPDLYQATIRDATASGLPTVIVFASPAFCTNAVCGPQDEVLQQLKDAYKGRANFIHVDFYDNPHEIQGDLARARISPSVIEWRLPSIEWTFVVDRDGTVSARFEAFATFEELEEALQKTL